MPLFPESFVADLKAQTDIVAIVGEITPLRQAGGTWKGLCPFHQEKTPSFTVHRDKGFFYCFGCQTGGDVLKFVELTQKIAFPEAVAVLAARAGLPLPDQAESGPERAAAALREAVLNLHEQAAVFYREQLATPGGARARGELETRGLTPATVEAFRYGYAPSSGRALAGWLADHRVPADLQRQSGLVVDREGRLVDRFRHRLLIPIARDNGAVVAFGGRALDEGQQPKYLNSPETPVYTKGRTLYGLDVTKGAIRKQNYCVLVEGYFDLAQVWQAGIQPVAALCGTALTTPQARTLKRFTAKVVLSLDPDTAGTSAAARSSSLLVAEGFQVNVALLPPGRDPDAFIREAGAKSYAERLTGSRPYLEFLLDRAAATRDLTRPDTRKRFLDEMLAIAAGIPDAAARDQFADRIAHKARIAEGVVRDEIRRAAVRKDTTAPAAAVAGLGRLRPAEQGLLWAIVHRPVEALAAIAQLEVEDLTGLVTAPVLRLAGSFTDLEPGLLPGLVRDRLNSTERAWLDRAAAADVPAAEATECTHTLRRLRVERERAAVQDEIDRLQERRGGDGLTLDALLEQKVALERQLHDDAAASAKDLM